MNQNIKAILFTESEISARVKAMGRQITQDYQGRSVCLVGILKGAVPFLVDLMRAVELPLAYDLMAVSSYGQSTKSSGTVRILKDLDIAIEGREVLIVEDIIDTGLTLHYIYENLRSRKPSSIKTCTFLDKPSRREAPIEPDYNGFIIPDVFVVGYGLDYGEQYRDLPYIGELEVQGS